MADLSLIKALVMRPKVLMLGALVFVLVGPIGHDMLLKPANTRMQELESKQKQLENDAVRHTQLSQRYQQLAASIPKLPSTLLAVSPEQSAKVAVVGVVDTLRRKIEGVATRLTTNTPTTEEAGPAAPSLQLLQLTGSPSKDVNLLDAQFPSYLKPELDGQLTELKAQEFPFTLEVRGPSAALVGLLNELASYKPLLVITGVDFRLDGQADPYTTHLVSSTPDSLAAAQQNRVASSASDPSSPQQGDNVNKAAPTALPSLPGLLSGLSPSSSSTAPSPTAPVTSSVNTPSWAPVILQVSFSLYIYEQKEGTTPIAPPPATGPQPTLPKPPTVLGPPGPMVQEPPATPSPTQANAPSAKTPTVFKAEAPE